MSASGYPTSLTRQEPPDMSVKPTDTDIWTILPEIAGRVYPTNANRIRYLRDPNRTTDHTTLQLKCCFK
jgi:hypothetical protein